MIIALAIWNILLTILVLNNLFGLRSNNKTWARHVDWHKDRDKNNTKDPK